MSGPIHPSASQPQPGDLVVREIWVPSQLGTSAGSRFLVVVHPATEGGAPHGTLEAAILLAQALAVQRTRAVCIWRELSGREGAYENLTHTPTRKRTH